MTDGELPKIDLPRVGIADFSDEQGDVIKIPKAPNKREKPSVKDVDEAEAKGKKIVAGLFAKVKKVIQGPLFSKDVEQKIADLKNQPAADAGAAQTTREILAGNVQGISINAGTDSNEITITGRGKEAATPELHPQSKPAVAQKTEAVVGVNEATTMGGGMSLQRQLELTRSQENKAKIKQSAYLSEVASQLETERAEVAKKTGETSDDGLLFKSLIQASNPENGKQLWNKFQTDYRQAAKEGKLNGGKAVESWQRQWAKENCGREDIYADIAHFKASTKMETLIVMGEKVKNPAQALKRLGYEVGRALGFGPTPLSGKQIAEIYGLDAKILNDPSPGNILRFIPTNGTLALADSAGKVTNVFLPLESKKYYLAQLKKEKGIAET